MFRAKISREVVFNEVVQGDVSYWIYKVYDTNKPDISVMTGIRLTHNGALNAACICLKHKG